VRKTHLRRVILALVAAAALLVPLGCASTNQTAARWLQRGEAEQLLVQQAARAEQDPDPDNAPAGPSQMEAQGDLLAAQGQPWGALHQYRQARLQAQGQAKPRLQGKIAGLYLRLGSFRQAKEMFTELCRQQPEQAVYWQGLGLSHLALGERLLAEEALRQAVERDPSLWRAQNTLGILYNQNREPEKAMAVFGAALQSAPDRPALHNNLGLSFLLAGRRSEAEACFRRALALDPGHRLANNNLGLLLTSEGRLDEALQVFGQGLGRAKAHYNLGLLLAMQGDVGGAREQFHLALSVMPRYYSKASRHLERLGEGSAGPAPSWQPAQAPRAAPAGARSPICPSRPTTTRNRRSSLASRAFCSTISLKVEAISPGSPT